MATSRGSRRVKEDWDPWGLFCALSDSCMYRLSANGWKVVSYVAMHCLRLYPERDFARQNPSLAALHNDFFKMGRSIPLPPTDDRPYRNVTGEFGEAQRFAVLSLHQLCHGVRTEKGRFQDYGTGLSKSSLTEAINEAIAESILIRKPQKSSGGRDLPSLYGINWDLIRERNWRRGNFKRKPEVSVRLPDTSATEKK